MSEIVAVLPDERGRFGPYGGQYVPETLMAALGELPVRDFVDQAEVNQRVIELAKAESGPSPNAAQVASARERVEIHTFDFVTLSKAGRASGA